MENGNAPSEACAEPAYRLRGEGDLRHEHDGASPTLEGSGARLEIDLGLPASRRAVQEEMAAPCIECCDDTSDRVALSMRQLGGLGLSGKGVGECRRSTLSAARPQ